MYVIALPLNYAIFPYASGYPRYDNHWASERKSERATTAESPTNAGYLMAVLYFSEAHLGIDTDTITLFYSFSRRTSSEGTESAAAPRIDWRRPIDEGSRCACGNSREASFKVGVFQGACGSEQREAKSRDGG